MHMQVKPVRRPGQSSARRSVFRAIRLFVALGVVAGVCCLGWRAMTVVVSEQAYINAEIVSVRAPIAGELQTQGIESGQEVSAGTPLFRISNPRFADTMIASELSRMQELVDQIHHILECRLAGQRLMVPARKGFQECARNA